MKTHPVGEELFQADAQTGVTKLMVAFRSFGDTPKNLQSTGKKCYAWLSE